MKKLLVKICLFVVLTMVVAMPAMAAGGIQDNQGNGLPLYVIIQVNWDGQTPMGDWTVHGPVWEPTVDGPILTSCVSCLEMNYDFTFAGNTLQFDENFVNTVEATPQSRHIVLKDVDGDGVYTGSMSAWHYFPWTDGSTILYFDKYDYTVTVVGGQVVDFQYVQYEFKK